MVDGYMRNRNRSSPKLYYYLF